MLIYQSDLTKIFIRVLLTSNIQVYYGEKLCLNDLDLLRGVIKKRRIRSMNYELQFHHISIHSDAKSNVMQILPLVNSH